MPKTVTKWLFATEGNIILFRGDIVDQTDTEYHVALHYPWNNFYGRDKIWIPLNGAFRMEIIDAEGQQSKVKQDQRQIEILKEYK